MLYITLITFFPTFAYTHTQLASPSSDSYYNPNNFHFIPAFLLETPHSTILEMVTFNDLPGELKNAVLDAFVENADLQDLMKARAANRLLAARMSYALLAQVHPSEFTKYYEDYKRTQDPVSTAPRRLAPYCYWRDNLATVLHNQLPKPCGAALGFLDFLHKVADIVTVGSGADRITLLKNLAQAVAAIDPDDVTRIEAICWLAGQADTSEVHVPPDDKIAYLAMKPPSDQDVLAASSAVGNATIIAAKLGLGVLPLGASPFRECHGLPTPVSAAASIGKTASLELLLAGEERLIAQAGLHAYDRQHLYERIAPAIKTATDHGHVEAAVMLIRFSQKYCKQYIVENNRFETFLERAAQHGNAGLSEALIETPDLAVSFARAEDVRRAVCAALTPYGLDDYHGQSAMPPGSTTRQVETIRYFLDSGVISLQDDAPGSLTLGEVMRYAPTRDNVCLIEFLISRGATKQHVQFALVQALTPPPPRSYELRGQSYR